jgi:serine/threonine protein kinase
MEEGTVVSGRYRLVSVIGRGGMGEVWAGVHLGTGRKVAVKLLNSKFLDNPSIVERFGREARAASAIEHPGIADVFDVDRTEAGVPYLVMEFLQGETLGQRIEELGRITEAKAVDVVVQLLEALHVAHERGIVHRDLKPDNLFLVPKGPEKEVVKILDFGISQKADEVHATKLTQAGSVLGTPHYMSPEQAIGQATIDGRADIYAAGIVLYECLVGDVPFDADNYNALLATILRDQPPAPSARGANVSASVEKVILMAMEKDREMRPQSAAQMRSMLLAAVQGAEPAPISQSFALPNASEPDALAPPARQASSIPLTDAWSDPSGLVSKPAPRQPEPAFRSVPSSADETGRMRTVEAPAPAKTGFQDFESQLSVGTGLEIDDSALARPRLSTSRGETIRHESARTTPTGRQDAVRTTSAAPHERMSSEVADAARPSGTQSNLQTRVSTRPLGRQGHETSNVLKVVFIGVGVLVIGMFLAVRFLRTPESATNDMPPVRPPVVAVNPAPPTSPDTPPSPAVVPNVQFVNIDITGIPNTATTNVNGLPVGAMPMRVRLGERQTIVITAPGFERREFDLTPTGDRRFPADMKRLGSGKRPR